MDRPPGTRTTRSQKSQRDKSPLPPLKEKKFKSTMPPPATSRQQKSAGPSSSTAPAELAGLDALRQSALESIKDGTTEISRLTNINQSGYRVPHGLMDYLLGVTNIAPIDYTSQMERWRADIWKNLVDPPDGLTVGHFSLCIPLDWNNRDALFKLREAANHLAIARIRQVSSQGPSALNGLGESLNIPYPELYYPPTGDQSSQDIGPLIGQFKEISRQLTDALTLFSRDSLTHLQAYKSAITDNVQSIRAQTAAGLDALKGELYKFQQLSKLLIRKTRLPFLLKRRTLRRGIG